MRESGISNLLWNFLAHFLVLKISINAMKHEYMKREVIQGAFFNCSSQFSVPKWKTMGSQSEILFHEILDVQKILVGWTTFFFLALKFGRNS